MFCSREQKEGGGRVFTGEEECAGQKRERHFQGAAGGSVRRQAGREGGCRDAYDPRRTHIDTAGGTTSMMSFSP